MCENRLFIAIYAYNAISLVDSRLSFSATMSPAIIRTIYFIWKYIHPNEIIE